MPTSRELLAEVKAEIREIDGAEAERSLSAALVLDVREPDEYEQGAIPGALHIPRGHLESQARLAGQMEHDVDGPVAELAGFTGGAVEDAVELVAPADGHGDAASETLGPPRRVEVVADRRGPEVVLDHDRMAQDRHLTAEAHPRRDDQPGLGPALRVFGYSDQDAVGGQTDPLGRIRLFNSADGAFDIARMGTDGPNVLGVTLRLRDREGKDRAIMLVGEDGNPSINLLDADESDIQPRDEVRIGAQEVKAEAPRGQTHETWKWIALAALGIVLLEWFFYHRRYG